MAFQFLILVLPRLCVSKLYSPSVGNVQRANVTEHVDNLWTVSIVDSGDAHNLGVMLVDGVTSQLPTRTYLPSSDADAPRTVGETHESHYESLLVGRTKRDMAASRIK